MRVNRLAVAVTVVFSAVLLGSAPALADITNATATNVQGGDNRATTNQRGGSTSGAANGGQITGVVAAGRTSVDARNTSSNSSVSSGEANAGNAASSFVGLDRTSGESEVGVDDLSFVTVPGDGNVQDGNNRQTLSQSASATTGDGVAGQVIGAVTGGGTTSIVAANTTNNSDVATGEARAGNTANAFVGLANTGDEMEVGVEDINNVTLDNGSVQNGNNRQTGAQTATSHTGDGVVGQVIGVVSSGATSVDANNTSDNVDVQTGDADSANRSDEFTGLAFTDSPALEVGPGDISGVTGNDRGLSVQDGSNRQTLSQAATSTTGDGVAGEVIGAVTSAGGSNSIVAANSSKNSDVTTGDAHSTNKSGDFVGLVDVGNGHLDIGQSDISGVEGQTMNIQDGNNRQTVRQSAAASTGDGVAGQVIGSVSAGRTSIDARNSTDDTSVETGDARASNVSAGFVGLTFVGSDALSVGPTDITNITGHDHLNVQDGNNRQTLSQTAAASSGDGVGGQVIGDVTSAGGSASIVAANTSTSDDVQTGDARSSNESFASVGLVNADGDIDIGDISGFNNNDDHISNIQDGNNRLTNSQTAVASTGDGVAGQVLGVVSAGATSLDANNTSADSTATTGDASASNAESAFVGLAIPRNGDLAVGDISGVNRPGNIQDGNNTKTLGQNAAATTGDAVSGEVTGIVTSAGGSTSAVLANTSTSIDSQSGAATFDNTGNDFVGLGTVDGTVTV